EIKHHFIQRQLIGEHHARRAYVLKRFLLSALLFHQLENAADILLIRKNGGKNDRFFHFPYLALRGPAGGIIDFNHLTVSFGDFVAHAGRRGDQVKAEFAFQPFLDDLHVEQTEESAAEPEAKRGRTFRFEEKRRVVEPKLFQGFA